jgi:hypothetical protein
MAGSALRDGRMGVTLRSKLLPHNLFNFLLLYCCVVLAFTQASPAKSQQVFSTKVVTPAGDQFWTNSIIIAFETIGCPTVNAEPPFNPP